MNLILDRNRVKVRLAGDRRRSSLKQRGGCGLHRSSVGRAALDHLHLHLRGFQHARGAALTLEVEGPKPEGNHTDDEEEDRAPEAGVAAFDGQGEADQGDQTAVDPNGTLP